MRQIPYVRGRGVCVWLAVVATTLLPFVHAHAGTIGSHSGNHSHPPLVHSVFSPDEATHPLSEHAANNVSPAQVPFLHGLGQEMGVVPGASSPAVFFGSLFAPMWLSPPASSSLLASSFLPHPAGGSISSTAPRGPPASPLS